MHKVISYLPKTLKEALEVLSKDDVIIMAGGSDLMVSGCEYPELIPSFDKPVMQIRNLKELRKIRMSGGKLKIGALCTSAEIASNPLVPWALRQAAGHMGAVGLRNSATIGGNINNASPKGDMPGPLYLLDAKVELTSLRGKRRVPLEKYILGLKHTDRCPDELMTAVIVPLRDDDFDHFLWHKVGFRAANAISKLTLTCAIRFDGDKVADFRVSATACGEKTNRVKKTCEKPFIGLTKKEMIEAIPKVQAAFDKIISPRAMPELRRKATENLIRDFIERSCSGKAEKFMN